MHRVVIRTGSKAAIGGVFQIVHDETIHTRFEIDAELEHSKLLSCQLQNDHSQLGKARRGVVIMMMMMMTMCYSL